MTPIGPSGGTPYPRRPPVLSQPFGKVFRPLPALRNSLPPSGMGWEALMEGRAGSVGCSGVLTGIGKPSQRTYRGRVAIPEHWQGS